MDFDILAKIQDDGENYFEDDDIEDDILNDIDIDLQPKSKKEIELKEVDNGIPVDSQFLESFHQMISDINENIEELQHLIEELGDEYSSFKTSVKTTEVLKSKRKTFEKKRKEIRKISNEIKDALDYLAKKNKTLRQNPETAGCSELIIRENQYQKVTNEFMETVKVFEELQSEYKKQHYKDLKRQVILTLEVDESEAEDIINSDNFQEDKLLTGFLFSKVNQQTMQSELDEIKETRDDLLDLEASMTELHEMFKDFFVLVNLQQDTIDSIEHQIHKASNYSKKAVKNLKNAVKAQNKTKNASLVMIICAIFIVIVVILIILVLLIVGIPALIGFIILIYKLAVPV